MTIPPHHFNSLPSCNLSPGQSHSDSQSQSHGQSLSGSLNSNRTIIGWREWVALPLLGIQRLDAKIDTGARSSSLDVHSIEEFQKRKERWVRFRILDDVDMSMAGREVEAKLLEYRNVKASSGHVTHRPVIQTTLELGLHCFVVELTLSNRRSMGYRMLLGRLAIESRFLVDASRSHLLGANTSSALSQP